jgi:pimeloyl-ACP methyl ester carboxylesterase
MSAESRASPQTVQLLILGATYNRIYWNFSNRSYAQYAAAHGQAVFAVDRLDTEASTQVNAQLLTLAADASSMHQVIAALRHGIGGHTFAEVVSIGHSYGSMIAYAEASTYDDVDAVGLTGFSHLVRPALVAAIPTLFAPVQLDGAPQFRGRPLGEVTIEGPDREKWFYAAGDIDPNILAEDTRTRDSLSDGELASFVRYELQPNMIRVPVLLAIGSKDTIFGCVTAVLSFCSGDWSGLSGCLI